jgi:hypothetical protein
MSANLMRIRISKGFINFISLQENVLNNFISTFQGPTLSTVSGGLSTLMIETADRRSVGF